MKITDVRTFLYRAGGANRRYGPILFVRVDTDAGISGWGEGSTWAGGAALIADFGIRQVRDMLVGRDPSEIEAIWHDIYRRYTYMGSRGMPTQVLSAIDIALWDIKGKALERPIYDLLGGKVRETVPVYANAWWPDGACEPQEFADAALRTVETGHRSLKFDPFLEMAAAFYAYVSGEITPDHESAGIARVAAVREAVGPNVHILIDAHGQYDVPSAIRIADRLAELDVAWLEEPVPPESHDALRQVRENTAVPICVGERLFTRFDFAPILERRLADFVMPDVCWTGGISELRRIGALAEAHYVPLSPHNAAGPIQIAAGSHVGLTTPNFYRLEHAMGWIPVYNAPLREPLGFERDLLTVSDRPGLGIEVDEDYLERHRYTESETFA
ncbi:MAG: mandelate racemase/muconate lactonizing enzyme family protein [Chloroflexi bacterium]|nr:mandelate racemase/muconate lactonizing enzyme family protein [Chloroflexota bacterium]